jgi:hypothetical protein
MSKNPFSGKHLQKKENSTGNKTVKKICSSYRIYGYIFFYAFTFMKCDKISKRLVESTRIEYEYLNVANSYPKSFHSFRKSRFNMQNVYFAIDWLLLTLNKTTLHFRRNPNREKSHI